MLEKLQFRPGLNREGTDYSNEGGWYDGDKIRFRSGFPEKIGGWVQVSPSQFIGTCRSLWVWADADAGAGTSYIGAGTSKKYYIFGLGVFNDVTPIVQTNTLTNPFSTVSGLATVTVADATYSPSLGDYVIFSGSTSVGGLTLNGEFSVTALPSPGTYQITATTTAGSTATGGGTVTAQYEFPVGLDTFSVGTGWGAGPWNAGTVSDPWAHGWGTASTYSSGIGQQLRLWSNDNFGADLVIAPRGGPIYYWADATGVTVRAQSIVSLANSTTSFTDATSFPIGATSVMVTSANAPYVYPYMHITGVGIPAGTYVAPSYVTGSVIVPIVTTSTTYTVAFDFGAGMGAMPMGTVPFATRMTVTATYSYTAATTAPSSGEYAFSYAGAFAPVATYQAITSSIQEFVIAFGSNSYIPGNPNTTFNPMLVRWSDQANPYQWIPQVENQSGEYLLTNGSFIMGARTTRQEILVWTDSCLYSMQYIGAPYVWGFQVLMDNISVMSPNAMITINNVTYWMGRDRFYMYSGRVEVLPCTLRQYIYSDLNTDQAYQVFTASNEGFNEVWWFYVSNSSGGTAIDKYVVYNYLDRVWYYGTMARTAWIQSGIVSGPIAADYNNRLLYHEVGTDDVSSGTSQPIDAYVQSSDFDIGDGHNFGFVWRILPDVNFNGSTVNEPYVTMTLRPRRNSGTPYGTADTPTVQSMQNYTTVPQYTVQEFDGQVYTRLRARQMSFRIESGSLGVAWQLGTPRIDVRKDGRR